MQVTLAYGRSGLAVELPEEWTDVVEPRDVAGLPDKPAAVSATLRAAGDRRTRVDSRSTPSSVSGSAAGRVPGPCRVG